MKKLISVLVAALMAVTMCVASLPAAFAAPSPQTVPTTQAIHNNFTVNGTGSTDIKYIQSSTNANEITFTYTGDGTLTGWTTNLQALGFVEGVDYTLRNNADGSITITFITQKAIAAWGNNSVSINAVVGFETETDVTDDTEETDVSDDEEETKKKNESSKSPDTGAPSALAAGSIAVLGAGVAVLAATKKRNAE